MSHFDYHPNRFQAQCILQDDFRCSIPVGLGPSSSSSSSSSIRASGLNSCTVNNLDSTSLGHLGQTVVEFRSFRKQNNIPELVLGKFARTLLFQGKHHGFLLPFSQDISTMGITGVLLCRGGKARVASCPFVADFRCVGLSPTTPAMEPTILEVQGKLVVWSLQLQAIYRGGPTTYGPQRGRQMEGGEVGQQALATVNPSWSEKVRDEVTLRALRPHGLPRGDAGMESSTSARTGGEDGSMNAPEIRDLLTMFIQQSNQLKREVDELFQVQRRP